MDDRDENLIALEAVLSSPEYNLIKVRSGDEALRYLLDHEPALILMDVQMPELDGFETAKILKHSARTRDIPIIFITAINKDERFVHEGYAHGAVDYLHKPYDTHILRAKVAVFADLARKTRRLVDSERAIQRDERVARERQLAQLELKALRREQSDQRRYRDLVEGIHHGIVWSADQQSLAVSFVSASAERILGFPIDRWHGDLGFVENHVHPDDRARFREAIQSARVDGATPELEHRFIAQDGREVWMHTGLRLADVDQGGSTEIRALSLDITAMKDAEQRLLRAKQRSDFMAEASRVLSTSLNEARSLEDLGALIVPRMASRYSVELLQENGSWITAARAFAGTVDPSPEQNLAVSRIDRLSGPVQTSGARGKAASVIVPITSRRGLLGALTLLSPPDAEYDEDDLSIIENLASRISSTLEHARLYQDAQAAIRTRDEFLSIASHELKTPLTPLKIQIQALTRLLTHKTVTELPAEKLTTMLSASDHQVSRLSRLIDDLLDVARINAGRLDLTREKFDATALAREVVERFSVGPGASAKVAISLEAPRELPVHWDRFRIEQVLTNLITNAIKYGQGKPISVRLRADGEMIEIAVRDHGIGIAPDDQGRIFQRFERAVSGNHFSGLGLGLYIVTQILEAHQGTILVQSSAGEGSTFIARIPRDGPVS